MEQKRKRERNDRILVPYIRFGYVVDQPEIEEELDGEVEEGDENEDVVDIIIEEDDSDDSDGPLIEWEEESYAYGPEPEDPVIAAIRAETNKFFRVRNDLNEEIAEYLSRDKTFSNIIGRMRQELDLPNLDHRHDGRTYFSAEKKRWVRESQFLEGLPRKAREQFEIAVNAIIDKYELPAGFHDWLIERILYDRRPHWEPTFNFELCTDIFENPERVNRVGLTAGEKVFIDEYIKKELGIQKGRPTLKNAELLKKINAVLAANKKQKPTFPSFREALAIYDRRKTIPEGGSKYDLLYESIVEKLYPPANSVAQHKQRVIRARKYVERLEKRMDELVKNK